ncbi:hypothetical protein [Magnetospirillum aberrantis]|uniref:Uncharacterized protein n=1 Tax=Magnetospirillum aberrantis SpK TaxID=908842 RepID=A0A7C9UXT5_9PROT|nr:hypothetical protein [Magnetospirillum aberrantis]NFV81290.1 hypothetical protein [Magnetospirillum aberrantis SpK]
MGKIDTAFSKFDDPYFGSIRQSYTDFAAPQVEDQYKKAQESLAYALARNGIQDSTIAGSKQADLQKEYDLNRAAIADEGINQEKQARTSVSNERSNLVAQLQSTADPTAAASAAASSASALSMKPTFSPLGQLFSNIAGSLKYGGLPVYPDGSGVLDRLKQTGLFGSPSTSAAGSSKVINSP